MRPEGKKNIERPPSEYFKQLYFDSLTHGAPALSYLASTVGPERIMIGTDYPFEIGDPEGRRALPAIERLPQSAKQKILRDNAAAVLDGAHRK